LIEVLFGYRDQGKYLLHEFVAMPDHIHLLLTPAVEISVEGQVWQEGYTNHHIRDAEDFERHCEYAV
jgi:putative transposase